MSSPGVTYKCWTLSFSEDELCQGEDDFFGLVKCSACWQLRNSAIVGPVDRGLGVQTRPDQTTKYLIRTNSTVKKGYGVLFGAIMP